MLVGKPLGRKFYVRLVRYRGLRREGWIKTTQVRTLSLQRFGRRAGRLDNGRLQEVADALVDVLAI